MPVINLGGLDRSPERRCASYYLPRRRLRVKIDPYLVTIAQDSEFGGFGSGSHYNSRDFISAAGTALFLVGGIIGAGIAYHYFSGRKPKPGEKVIVIPCQGPTYTGPWRGIDDVGDMCVGSRQYDPEYADIIAPLKHGGNH